MKKQPLINNPKQSATPQRLVLGIALVVIGLSWLVILLTSFNITQKSDYQKALTDVYIDQPQAPGKACGIISAQTVSDFLQTSTLSQTYNRVPNRQALQSSAPGYYYDSCLYTDTTNSNRFADVTIRTFATESQANESYETLRSEAYNPENHSFDQFGDKLFYDSGRYVLLNKNEILMSSASSGDIDKMQTVTKAFFELVLSRYF